jgi:tyrosinase
MGQRKNQANLTTAEWTAFLNALTAVSSTVPTTPAPRYRDFTRVHVAAMSMGGMSWAVHSMPQMSMDGRNFLAWHRHFILQLEKRLQQVDPAVNLPYWDWINQPSIPAKLAGSAFLSHYGITRQWNAGLLPHKPAVDAVKLRTTFAAFQPDLESVHNSVHRAVGGTMAGSSSPADPIFFLHHANIDRLWAEWQASPNGKNPTNGTETLQPATGYQVKFGIKVSSLLNISTLGYSYI